MDYQGTIIRPPSEADSILLQVTLGCSHGKCIFCGAYVGKNFGIKSPEQISKDIEFIATYCKKQRRLFLCDGDALILPQKRLLELLTEIKTKVPWITRIASYANAKSIARKSDAELCELKEHGLTLLYMGLESGSDEILERMNKYGTSGFIIEQGIRVREMGMKLSVTVINGLGGVTDSLKHAHATGRALSEMAPHQMAALSLMTVPGTPLHDQVEMGTFVIPSSTEILLEIREMLANINVKRGLFLANHASNYLPLKVRLPSGKAKALAEIDQALQGIGTIIPESFRRL